ncbi:MAG TPA: bacterial transcriptional activator domain-containing protein [Bacteroidota bacterium]|nr:bacterial transcriptional activator domain-containing protein [Bacteroidota bacterium]
MRKILPFLIATLVMAPPCPGDQQTIPEELDRLITQGIDLTLKQDYERADSVCRVATDRFPEDPLGYLYRAAVMQTRSMDYLDPLNFDTFDSLLAIARVHAEKIVDSHPQSPLGYFLLATAEGEGAYARVDAGNWLSGVTRGLGAASDFKKAVALDSACYDAYVGVGTYYYWKSKKAGFLNWALGDRRAEGIRLLEIAAVRGVYNRLAALSALTAIYTDAGEYDNAIRCATEGLRVYPDNRIFLWGISAAQERSGKYADAAQTYEHLLRTILGVKMPNPYNEMLCRLNLVKAYRAVGQSAGLREHLNAILSFERFSFPGNLANRAQEKFAQARTILGELGVDKGEHAGD